MLAAAMQIKTFILLSLTAVALVFSSDVADPFAASGKEDQKQKSDSPATEPEVRENDPKNLNVCYEVFSMPIAQAADLHRKGLTEEEFYKQVVKAGKIERFVVLNTQADGRAMVESASEFIYPTEFTPPQFPESINNTTQPPLPACPTAFTMRPIGEKFEIEPGFLVPDARFLGITCNVSLTSLLRLEKWAKDAAEVEQPIVDNQNFQISIVAKLGSPQLLGTLNPPFENGVNPRKDQALWFCFVTVRVIGDSAKAGK